MFDAAKVPVLTPTAIGYPSELARDVRPQWHSRGTEGRGKVELVLPDADVHAMVQRSPNGSATPGLLVPPEAVHR